MTSSKPYLLLVEDNEADVFLTTRILRNQGLADDIVVARDGAEAVEMLLGGGGTNEAPSSSLPRVVLLDIKMPRMDGFEVLRRLRESERTKRLPVVMFTSSGETTDVVESYDHRANSYVRKPVDSDAYTEAVEQVGVYWLALNECVHEHDTG